MTDTTPEAVASTAGLGPTPRDDEHPYTYASTQATDCAAEPGGADYKRWKALQTHNA
jgi:hypothetical protein